MKRRRPKRAIAQFIENRRGMGESITSFFRGDSADNDFDYLNLEHNEWCCGTDGVPHSGDFFEVFNKAIVDTSDFASRFRECADRRTPVYFLKNYRFDNGADNNEKDD